MSLAGAAGASILLSFPVLAQVDQNSVQGGSTTGGQQLNNGGFGTGTSSGTDGGGFTGGSGTGTGGYNTGGPAQEAVSKLCGNFEAVFYLTHSKDCPTREHC